MYRRGWMARSRIESVLPFRRLLAAAHILTGRRPRHRRVRTGARDRGAARCVAAGDATRSHRPAAHHGPRPRQPYEHAQSRGQVRLALRHARRAAVRVHPRSGPLRRAAAVSRHSRNACRPVAHSTPCRRPAAPSLQEITEFTAAGFALIKVMEWPYFGEGEHG